MTTSMLRMMTAVAVVMVLAMSLPAHAADSKKDLQDRFEKRYPNVAKLLNEGLVGETSEGYLEPVRPDTAFRDDAKKLVEDENADRKKLYALLAQEYRNEKPAPTPAQVGERNARRKFQEAKPVWFLKTKEGRWIQRKETAALKKSGKIGETWEGYLESVKGQDLDDQAKAVFAEENRIRKDLYERAAEKNKTKVKDEAEAAGKKNIANVKPGESFKDKDGNWSKKDK